MWLRPDPPPCLRIQALKIISGPDVGLRRVSSIATYQAAVFMDKGGDALDLLLREPERAHHCRQ